MIDVQPLGHHGLARGVDEIEPQITPATLARELRRTVGKSAGASGRDLERALRLLEIAPPTDEVLLLDLRIEEMNVAMLQVEDALVRTLELLPDRCTASDRALDVRLVHRARLG